MSDRFRVNCEKNNEPIKYQRMTGIGRTATVSSCSFYRFFDSAAASDRSVPKAVIRLTENQLVR